MAEKKKWTQERVTLRIGTGLVLLAATGLLSMAFPLLYIAVGAVVAFFVGCPVIEKLTLPGLPDWSWGNGRSKVDGNKVLDAAKAHSNTSKEKQDAPAMPLIGEKIACPKCTSKPLSVKLCNGKEQRELLFDTKTFTFSDDGCNYKDEHLHVTCGLCGHQWVCQTNL